MPSAFFRYSLLMRPALIVSILFEFCKSRMDHQTNGSYHSNQQSDIQSKFFKTRPLLTRPTLDRLSFFAHDGVVA